MSNLNKKIYSDIELNPYALGLKFLNDHDYPNAVKYFRIFERSKEFTPNTRFYLNMYKALFRSRNNIDPGEYIKKANETVKIGQPEYLEVKLLLSEYFYSVYHSTVTALELLIKNPNIAVIPDQIISNAYNSAANHLENYINLFSENSELLAYAFCFGDTHGYKTYENFYIDMHLKLIKIFNDLINDPHDKKLYYLEKLFNEYYYIIQNADYEHKLYLSYLIMKNKDKIKPSIYNTIYT